MAHPSRAHRVPALLVAQRARFTEPPVTSLNALAVEIEHATGYVVPRFDPSSAGVDAEALLLLQSPGPASTSERGSGIISAFNDDATAEHFHQLLTRHGIGFDRILLWNVVPWWLPATSTTGTFRSPGSADLSAAAPWLERVLALLPKTRAIVTLGRKAQTGLERYAADRELPYTMMACPHPAGQAWNRSHLRQATEDAFAALATLLNDEPGVSRGASRLLAWVPLTGHRTSNTVGSWKPATSAT